MKRIALLTLALLLVASVGLAAEPQDDIDIFVDGKEIKMEVLPRIQDGRTLVPARFIFEPLGAEMRWDDENQVASGMLGDHQVDIPIDSTEATVNGETEELDVPAQIFESRTFIPLRFAGEAFGRSVEWDGEARTITVDEMRLLHTEDRWEEIGEVSFSPDGDTIAVGGRYLSLFSAADREVFYCEGDVPIHEQLEKSGMDFSPDGSMLALVGGSGDGIFDAQDLTEIQPLAGHEDGVVFSPDGNRLATRDWSAGTVTLWEKQDGGDFEEVQVFDPDGRYAHSPEFSPDGKYLTAGFYDGIVRIWDVEARELAGTIDFETSGRHHHLTFSPDGEILATTDPDLASDFYLFDTEDFSTIEVFEPEGRVSRMQFSPDGSKLAYGGFGGEVEIFCTEDWSLIYSFEHDGTVRGLCFGPDSRNMAVGSDNGTLYLYGYE